MRLTLVSTNFCTIWYNVLQFTPKASSSTASDRTQATARAARLLVLFRCFRQAAAPSAWTPARCPPPSSAPSLRQSCMRTPRDRSGIGLRWIADRPEQLH
eukprot:4674179-Pleurochrysis_carterae.AAC.1